MMHTALLRTFSRSTLNNKLPNLHSQGLSCLQSRGLPTFARTAGLDVPQTTTIPQNVQSLFNMLDLDSNGVLDKSEFFAATSKLNLNLSEGEWTVEVIGRFAPSVLVIGRFAPSVLATLF